MPICTRHSLNLNKIISHTIVYFPRPWTYKGMCFFAIRGWLRRVKRSWTADKSSPRGKLDEIPLEANKALPCQPPSHDIFGDKRLLLATPKGSNESDSTARLEELPLHVIVLISNHLTDTCRMSFALTCHSLYRALLNNDEQLQLVIPRTGRSLTRAQN